MTTVTPTKQTPADVIAAALVDQPGATAAELADAAGIGRSTAAKALAVMEQEGTARRIPGGRDGGLRLPNRWELVVDGAAGDEPAVEGGGPAVTAYVDERNTGPGEAESGRLEKGALRSLVFDYVATHAGPDGLGPTAVAKGLGGRSSGAVGNALSRLEADGRVRLVKGSPRRYATAG